MSSVFIVLVSPGLRGPLPCSHTCSSYSRLCPEAGFRGFCPLLFS